MDLCGRCRGINVSNLVPRNGECYQLYPTYNELRESAPRCSLCLLFFTALENKNRNRVLPADLGNIEDYQKGEDSTVWLISGHRDAIMIPRGSEMGITGVRVNVGGAQYMKEADLTITTAPDDPLALCGDVTGRSERCEPGSEPCLAQIQQWFGECERNHPVCARPFVSAGASPVHSPHFSRLEYTATLVMAGFGSPEGQLDGAARSPSRLVDVGSPHSGGTLHLRETNRRDNRYAALSYSWGPKGSIKFTTKTATYKDRLAGFQLGDLPTTIRDAVVLTRKLGLPYIWIDALCIIQDDLEDWAIESARMNEVYGNAVLTIAATACEDKWDGLFRRWESSPSTSVSINSICSNRNGQGTMTISSKLGSVYDMLERSPLSKRAWVLQERVLSRRIIHFAQDQLYWECQDHSVAEDGTLFADSLAINKCLSRTGDFSNREPFSNIKRTWGLLVIEYARRELFAKADKLPAFSGLAKEVQSRTGVEPSDYLAGIWRADLPAGLLWGVAQTEEREEQPRPAKWRAPSWSWASVDGYVFSLPELPRELLRAVEILEITTEPRSSANPLGEVKCGRMRVRGMLRPVRRLSKRVRVEPNYQLDEYDEKGRSIGLFFVDYSGQSLDFTCLLIKSDMSGTGILIHYFLGLVNDGGINTYRRIGVGYTTRAGKDFFDNCEPSTIEIT